MKKLVVALGGNALQESSKPATSESQLEVVKKTVKSIADLIARGDTVIITHGNGPQVGRILIQNEIASSVTPAMPFDVCGAMSQGMIGYHIQQALSDELASRGIKKTVVSVVTQVVVDKNDQGFKNPTKPVGLFYTKEESDKIAKEKGYIMVEDSGRGYRRVVASPVPIDILEINAIKTLVDAGYVVIAAGGGGIPVIKTQSGYEGAAAVIDKDFASAKLAQMLDADTFVILTGVNKVSINFGKENQKDLDRITVADAKKYIAEKQFGVGSMLPKVEAAIIFATGGKQTLISSLDQISAALDGKSGTIIG